MEEAYVPDNNSLTIEDTLQPIVYTSWLLGVGVARPRKYPKIITIIIHSLYLVLCFVNIVYNVKDYHIFREDFDIDTDIHKIMFFANLGIIYVVTFYDVYHGIKLYDKWPELMDRIKNLDQKINEETLMNDRSLKIMEALAILTTFAWSLITYISYYYFTNVQHIFVSNLLFFFIAARSLINSFVFDIVVYVLYYRLRTINQLIGQLNKSSEATLIALKIKWIRKLHNVIYDLVVMINDIHGLHLLLCAVNTFTVVITKLLIVYLSVKSVKKDYTVILVNNGIWILYTMQFGLMCWICTLARQESNMIGININAFVLNCKPVNLDKVNRVKSQSYPDVSIEDPGSKKNFNRNGHNLNYVVVENLLCKDIAQDCIRNEISDFLIQLQQYQVTFTACDFFEMSNALFCGFIGVIATYLIIFIQFHQQSEHRNIDNVIQMAPEHN
ncbi:uncharacterized protein LOC105829257 [Monomorium pharaonis]|uniref:uncharacterized protein LOC105829257 n=1 Tax=Monomorium pharaonis TaxID=307658 RepID=UPI001745FDF4|nr:uncharacterized protein LOC105829257 [Monomorium pharaonis]